MEIKVEENNDLVKDTRSGAILNTNTNAYTAFKRRKLYNQQRENDINSMKEELSEIKMMMKTLMEKL